VSRQAQATLDAEEATLLARVRAIAAKTRESYGSRRLAKALRGIHVRRDSWKTAIVT